MTRVRTSDAQAQLAAQLREAAEDAAGPDGMVSRTDQPKLEPFLGARADALRAEEPRRRVTVDRLVVRGMTDAMEVWDRANPPAEPENHRWLSRREVHEIGAQDPALGNLTTRAYERALLLAPTRDRSLIPELSLRTEDDRIAMTANGDVVTLTATADVPHNTALVLYVDGTSIPLRRFANGFSTHQLEEAVPEGHGAAHLEHATRNGVTTSIARIRRDPQGWLSSGEALAEARDALVGYVRDIRSKDRDWQEAFGLTWDQAVARGVLDELARFASPDAPGTQVLRGLDEYTFAGRGPLGLYTEVSVQKRTGRITGMLVEID